MKTYSNFIDGKWVNSLTKKTFPSLNPANEKVIANFQSSNYQDVEKAVESAEKAFPYWSTVPAPKRAEILLEVARLLKKDKDKLAKIMVMEMGKVYKESAGDVQEAIDVFEYMVGEGRRLFGITTPSELKRSMYEIIS